MPEHRHLIICGAEKAGTTSLYTYLAAHPGVCASVRKETDHFRSPGATAASYRKEFPASAPAGAVLMESSPAYLAESHEVVPRLAAVVPHACLVFVLRDPIDRLRSSFRFYKSRLHVPNDMSIDRFVELCAAYAEGRTVKSAPALKSWHLKALERGRYERLLPSFTAHFPQHRVLILSFDELQENVAAPVQRICRLAGLNHTFYDDYDFRKENVGFQANHLGVQKLAIFINDRFQSIWRRNPQLKRTMLTVYKKLNEKSAPIDELSQFTRQYLIDYYKPTFRLMGTLHASAQKSSSPHVE